MHDAQPDTVEKIKALLAQATPGEHQEVYSWLKEHTDAGRYVVMRMAERDLIIDMRPRHGEA